MSLKLSPSVGIVSGAFWPEPEKHDNGRADGTNGPFAVSAMPVPMQREYFSPLSSAE